MLTAGICRWLYRRGVRVAPFKAQNMSNNSTVAVERLVDRSGDQSSGQSNGQGGRQGGWRAGELGRAQALQAVACGLAPSVRFNPVLLKPGADNSSQVVLLGQSIGTVGAGGLDFRQLRPTLARTVQDTLAGLRAEYDVVVCEGAGSLTEINLRAHDYVNLGLARPAHLPVIVVADIDRGGVFASLFGSLALLSPADQALVAGFVINKFRGDPDLLAPGLGMLRDLTGRPTYGVLPWQLDLWLDAEDALAYGQVLGRPGPPHGTEWLRVAVVRLPRISNATDAEALATEPGVRVRLTVEPAEIADADLVVLPGSKATVDDLRWLRGSGLADALVTHAAAGKPLIGICGGFQMLGRAIHDTVESRAGTVEGLGLLPVEVTFAADKTLALPSGTFDGGPAGLRDAIGRDEPRKKTADGVPVGGYEIHHGRVTATDCAELFRRVDGLPGGGAGPESTAGAAGSGSMEGARSGAVFGTHWHGIFEHDEFRRAFLTVAARLAGRPGFAVAPDTNFQRVRERTVDLAGDLVEQYLDTDALWRLIESGPPADLPFVPPGAPG